MASSTALLFLVFLSFTIHIVDVQAKTNRIQIDLDNYATPRKLSEMEVQQRLKALNKPFLKSFKKDGGETIDCVPIYSQPAFDLPILKNHKIEEELIHIDPPKKCPKEYDEKNASTILTQLWSFNESCPEGTVPIRRTRKEDILRETSFTPYDDNLGTLAQLTAYRNRDGNNRGYDGGYAELNVWQPKVQMHEESASFILVSRRSATVEAGWHVRPGYYGDWNPRIYGYWTDGGNTGCFNFRCSGFVQTSPTIALTSTAYPYSTYHGNQYLIGLAIFKGRRGWVLRFGVDGCRTEVVGYWPFALFKRTNFVDGWMSWGGRVKPLSSDSKPEMGSGHSPDGTKHLLGKVCYTRHIGVYDPTTPGELSKPWDSDTQDYTDDTTPYKLIDKDDNDFGRHIFFGGPLPQ